MQDSFLLFNFSKKEANEVRSLAEHKNLTVKSLTGLDASKNSIKRELKASNVVHIATHGYFGDSKNTINGTLDARDPLLESGLILAADAETKRCRDYPQRRLLNSIFRKLIL